MSTCSTLKRVYMFLSVLVSLLLLVASCLALPAYATATTSWDVQTVDANGMRGGNGYCPIAIDSNNRPGIAYTDVTFQHEDYQDFQVPLAMYASWNGSVWSTKNIDYGHPTSLVFDAEGNPHVLYTVPFGPLMYASWTGTNWTKQIVDSNPQGYGAVALDSFGNPHVAYTDGATIKYARWTGSNWTVQTVDTYGPGGILFGLSLSLDSNNTPYLFYDRPISISQWASHNLTLAIWRNSSWTVQNVAYAGGGGNMVLDSKGYPHMVYKLDYPEFTGIDNSTLVYASWNGSSWITQTVVSNTNIAALSLSLDSYDYPHISWVPSWSYFIPERGFQHLLMYARWNGTAWDNQTVSQDAQGPCCLTMDSEGNPHISYRAYQPSDTAGPDASAITYATANETKPVLPSSSSEPSSPTFSDYAPWVIASVTIVVIAVGALVYFKKRKRQAP
jgi:hypothetical protein